MSNIQQYRATLRVDGELTVGCRVILEDDHKGLLQELADVMQKRLDNSQARVQELEREAIDSSKMVPDWITNKIKADAIEEMLNDGLSEQLDPKVIGWIHARIGKLREGEDDRG